MYIAVLVENLSGLQVALGDGADLDDWTSQAAAPGVLEQHDPAIAFGASK